MANEQASLPIKSADNEISTNSDRANLHEKVLLKTSCYSLAEASHKASSILSPKIKPIPEKEEAQTSKSTQRTLMCKEVLEAATNNDDKNPLVQLLGLDEGESPDSKHITIETSNSALNHTRNLQSATHMGSTVLHILASNGQADMAVKTYMKDRSLLEVCNNRGETALHCAARYGYSSVISQLIDKAHQLEHDLKNTLRKKNWHGETALHEAARHGDTATVQTLIAEDPELAGQVNQNDESPLYLATVEGHAGVVELIVQHLCHRKITSAYYSGPKGTTALHASVLRSKEGMPDYRLRIKCGIGFSLVFWRKPRRKVPGLDIANELLILEPAMSVKGSDLRSTPLHYAASTGDARMAQKLLNHDTSLAYRDDSLGLFPVHVAAYMGHLKTLITLLENNLDSWELLDKRGRNFLHVGAEGKNNIIFQLIREKKSRYAWRNLGEVLRKAFYARDNEGNTPLHIAARCGDEFALKSLLQKEWVHFTRSLDNLALTNSKITTENYEEMYRHYKSLQLVGEAETCPRKWRLSYISRQNPLEPLDALATKVQTIALGSVLIATVTFAAAFTPPGGYNSTDGTPVLAKKYAFRAFILADVAAFVSSFLSTFYLILLGANSWSGHLLQKELYWIQYLFTISSISIGLAFALGLYLVLAPVNKAFSLFILVGALLAAIRIRYGPRKMLKWFFTCVAPFFVIFLFAFI